MFWSERDNTFLTQQDISINMIKEIEFHQKCLRDDIIDCEDFAIAIEQISAHYYAMNFELIKKHDNYEKTYRDYYLMKVNKEIEDCYNESGSLNDCSSHLEELKKNSKKNLKTKNLSQIWSPTLDITTSD